MNIQNVLFDLDGTLLDTREGLLESVKYTVKAMGLNELSDETLLQFIGPPVQNSFKKHFNFNDELAQKAADVFREYYKSSALLKAKPYDGIYELCDTLKAHGVRMGAATYKREDYARTLLRHFHFDEYFQSMHGADPFNKLKKRDIAELCLAELNGSTTDSVLIGDTIHDAACAEEINMPFVAVTYGFGFHSHGEANKYANIGIADSPTDILSILGVD